MMRKTNLIIVALMVLVSASKAQNDLESALASIRKNNASIAAFREHVQARKMSARTGLSPDDPNISADYMIGRPVSGGNQFDLTITQPFDFPTVYARKRRLAENQELLYDLEAAQFEQNVLWEAKQIGLRLIYLNKRKLVMDRRLSQAKYQLELYEAKFDAAEIGALEVNKARVHFLGLQNEHRKISAEIGVENERLVRMNGGLPIGIGDSLYPGPDSLPAFGELFAAIEAADLRQRRLDQQTLVERKQVEVSKALRLPKFESGYHYQSVLGQTFNGLHIGASIPLWEHKGRVRARESFLSFREMQKEEHRVNHKQESKSLYVRYESLKESRDEFRKALGGLNTFEILRKSLELGEIDFIRYAMELDYYYEAYDQFLETEYSYHMTISELLKHEL